MPGQDISEFPAIVEIGGVAKERKEPMEIKEEWENYVDPLTTEEKLIIAYETPVSLSPEEITEITEEALGRILNEGGSVDLLFDVIYEAIEEAVSLVSTRM